jgi:hypothetical protein
MAALDKAMLERLEGMGSYIFDMDETLARYRCVEVYKLVWRAVMEFLCRERGYAEELLEVDLDVSWVQKGTVRGAGGGQVRTMRGP